MPKYTTELVPTMPLPHAPAPAPAPAADAATGEAPYRDVSDYGDGGWWGERLVGPDGWECELGDPEDRAWGRDARPVVDELNRLALEVAALEAERDRLALELAGLRGALPSAVDLAALDDALNALNMWDDYSRDDRRDIARRVAAFAKRTRALSATPQPAEAVTGAEWGRGDWKIEHGDWHWLLIEGDPGPTQWEWYEGGGPPDDESWWVRDGYEPEGRVLIVGPPVSPPPGWEAALDTPQEADHAAQ